MTKINETNSETIGGSFSLFLKGLAMGAADIVPGISGGTVAFLSGIYEELLVAIKSINLEFLNLLLRKSFKQAFEYINLKFLFPLFLGIVISLLSLSGLIHSILTNYPIFTWSFFFGLILASVIMIGKKIEKISTSGGLYALMGIFLGYLLVGIIPLDTPNSNFFIILSGMITASAMILPGISGSFILLILGKYELMLLALKNPFVAKSMLLIFLFILGFALGLALLSRLLTLLFKKYQNVAVAVLTGFIFGSLRKIWPWKNIELYRVAGDHPSFRENNIIPDLSIELILPIIFFLLGLSLVFYLGKKMKQKKFSQNV